MLHHLRHVAPYIQMHRDKVCVIHLSGALFQHQDWQALVQDLALIHSLGIRLVLILGARPQIQARLQQQGIDSRFHQHNRITTAEQLPWIREIYAKLMQQLQEQMNLAAFEQSIDGTPIHIVHANWVTAMPLGIVDGVDQQLTGQARHIHVDAIQTNLTEGHVCVVTPLAQSATGQTYNLNSQQLSLNMAKALQADKAIVYVPSQWLEGLPTAIDSAEPVQCPANLIEDEYTSCHQLLQQCQDALGIINRVHLLAADQPCDLLEDLFTRDGKGALLHQHNYNQIRHATAQDIAGIFQLMQPLQQQGILATRTPQEIEKTLSTYRVMERDGKIVGSVSLRFYPDEQGQADLAELSALMVHPQEKSRGIAKALLKHCQQEAKTHGCHTLFALTTQTADWFIKQGFDKTSSDFLPANRLYNPQRNSLVFKQRL